MKSNTFVISYNLIKAFKDNADDRLESLTEELMANSSKVRSIIGKEYGNLYTVDQLISIYMHSAQEDELSGSFSVKYTVRRYVGQDEDEEIDNEEDILFEIDLERSEITLTTDEE